MNKYEVLVLEEDITTVKSLNKYIIKSDKPLYDDDFINAIYFSKYEEKERLNEYEPETSGDILELISVRVLE